MGIMCIAYPHACAHVDSYFMSENYLLILCLKFNDEG